MKAWEQWYNEKTLNEAKCICEDVKIIQNDGVEIIGEIEGFQVTTYIEYNSPTHASCNCPQKGSCKHEASLIYYLENNQELFCSELNFEEILYSASVEDLRKFLLIEIERNNDLKIEFLKKFNVDSLIDKSFYKNKLSDVFAKGKGKDFKYHGMYNLDLMESSLDSFLRYDISNLLVAGEYDFACDLLCEIGDLLEDELMSSFDSWYELSGSFMHYVHTLSTSIHLDSEKMDELHSKTRLITDVITIF